MKTIFSLLVIITVSAYVITPAIAQEPAKIPRIGVLSSGGGTRPTPGHNPNHRALRQGLEELGYVDGKNIRIESRAARGTLNLLPEIAAELVRLDVAVIVPSGPTAIKPVMEATKTIPIVMPNGSDPVGYGFVDSLIRPGGNVTGLSGKLPGLDKKQIELLKEAVPSITRLLALIPARRSVATVEAYKETAGALRVDVQFVDFYNPQDFDSALAKISTIRPDALITVQNTMTLRYASKLAKFAIENRLPLTTNDRRFVEAGALMSYGVNYPANWRRAAVFVDKILKGANPATLPVEPPQLELVINLKTAEKIGVKIPPEILLEASELIK